MIERDIRPTCIFVAYILTYLHRTLILLVFHILVSVPPNSLCSVCSVVPSVLGFSNYRQLDFYPHALATGIL